VTALKSSKAIGSSVEGAAINAEPALEYVGDSEATWHDAQTIECWSPTTRRPFLGTPVVESHTPVEIKGCCVVRSNGTRQRPSQWYVKRSAHERLLDAAGVYLLAVYAPRDETPILRSVVIPASLLDEHLDGSWYDVQGDRSEREVAELTWTNVIDRERVPGAGGGRGAE